MTYRVRPGGAGDAPLLGDVERAAAQRFAKVGLERIVRGRPTGEAEYLEVAARGQLWVVETAAEQPVGLAIADRLDGGAYLAEIAVHPDHGGQRLAARLIAEIERQAVAEGCRRLYLTTFDAVPWNRPYYEKLGFTVLAEAEAGPQLRAIRAGERKRGLDKLSPRVCMVKAT
jgi:GNAT superfamily N-acetyltransferase